MDVPAVRIVDVDRAGHARVERVDGPQDLERLLGSRHRRADERRPRRPRLPLRVARRGVPGARHDELVVLDLLVLDIDPVASAPRGASLSPTPLASFGQDDGIPARRCRRSGVSPAPMLAGELVVELLRPSCRRACVSIPRAAVRPRRGEQRRGTGRPAASGRRQSRPSPRRGPRRRRPASAPAGRPPSAWPFQRGVFSQEYFCVDVELLVRAAWGRCSWARLARPTGAAGSSSPSA